MYHQSNLQFKGKLKQRDDNATKCIVLHHSEVLSRHSVKDVHTWHKNKGWAGIGYHYFITKDGEIHTGRPRDTWGAHAYGHNGESVGVCFEGDFNKEDPRAKQLEASVLLLAILSLAYGNIPIFPHRELTTGKNCPGKRFPFESLWEKVEDCKHYLYAWYGSDFDYGALLNSQQ